VLEVRVPVHRGGQGGRRPRPIRPRAGRGRAVVQDRGAVGRRVGQEHGGCGSLLPRRRIVGLRGRHGRGPSHVQAHWGGRGGRYGADRPPGAGGSEIAQVVRVHDDAATLRGGRRAGHHAQVRRLRLVLLVNLGWRATHFGGVVACVAVAAAADDAVDVDLLLVAGHDAVSVAATLQTAAGATRIDGAADPFPELKRGGRNYISLRR